MMQTCPRRMEDFGPWQREENLDDWRRRADQLEAQGEGDHATQRADFELSCNFCGSLHPDTFMAWARRGGRLSPTDKNYKIYVHPPEADPREGERGTYNINLNGVGQNTVSWAYGTQCKFYFQHLSEEQRHEFIELLNAGVLNFADSGGFYRLPFFIARP